MPSIIGMNIYKISAERKKMATKGELEIKTHPQIIDIKETKIQGLSKDDISILSVDFVMSSSFNPDAGSISIEGVIMYKAENKEEIMNEWKKSKSLPLKDGAIILNYIFNKVAIVGLYLSDTLALPPIIAFPKVEPRANSKNTGEKTTPTTTPAHGKKE